MSNTSSSSTDLDSSQTSRHEFEQVTASLRGRRIFVFVVLTILLFIIFIFSLAFGAAKISIMQTISILCSQVGISPFVEFADSQETVLMSIRLPRVLLGILTGATLAVGGAAIQGLFRNPLAEPGLIGTSGGAAMAAVLAILFIAPVTEKIPQLGFWLLPISAFIGSVLMTLIVFRISVTMGRVEVATMLLAGIAINAFAFAVMGLAIFYADDAQLRTITFWTLGSLSGATWKSLIIAGPLMILGCFLLPMWGRSMDALALGESEAWHLGVPVNRVRTQTILIVALAVGASVSLAGMISFIGLVIPHFLRLLLGPSHRQLMIGSAIAGAALLTASDLFARTVASPAELPLGVITALIGAPYFLWLLLKNKNRGGLL